MRELLGSLALALAIACSDPTTAPPPLPAEWSTDADSTFFLQMADTQFGMWAKPVLFAYLGWGWRDAEFARETEHMERAIAHANRLAPGFVIFCGDLVNTPGHPGQTTEFQRIAARLDDSIPLYLVAGNHDVGNEPTPESLAGYREQFGRDWYRFRQGGVYGIVLNSQLIHSPAGAPDEAAAQLAWLRRELDAAKASGAPQILVFQHHPYFLSTPDEPDQYFNIPVERRALYLGLFRAAGVRAIFAGHYHRNAHGWDGALEMVTTGPVGKPLGEDPSGFRIVRIGEAGLDHAYVSLDAVPAQLGAPRVR